MASLKVRILDVTGSKVTTVELPDDVPMNRLIPALAKKMGLPIRQGDTSVVYALDHVPTRTRLRDHDTMASAGVQPDDALQLLPTFAAGGYPSIEGIPGINLLTVRDVAFEELSNSPPALVMVIRQYEHLQKEFNRQAIELEAERQKSTDRLTATIILLVSQVVLAIGANLLTSNQLVPAVVVLAAGGIQAVLAVYLSFRKPRLQR